MVHAYNKMYLSDAMMNLGELTEYAHDACGFDVDKALGMFVISGYADRFGKGDPMVVCGRSGTELFQDLCNKCGIQREWPKAIVKYSTEEYYWIGYILAYYQWFCNKSFSNIINVIKTKDLLNMYPALHTASEDKAVEVLMDLYNSRNATNRLQAYRKGLGMTQAELAADSGVNLRTLQQYESGAKSISKASAESVIALATVLHCRVEDLV